MYGLKMIYGLINSSTNKKNVQIKNDSWNVKWSTVVIRNGMMYGLKMIYGFWNDLLIKIMYGLKMILWIVKWCMD